MQSLDRITLGQIFYMLVSLWPMIRLLQYISIININVTRTCYIDVSKKTTLDIKSEDRFTSTGC